VDCGSSCLDIAPHCGKPDQPPRLSVTYFHQPNWEAVITPLDGSDADEPVFSGPYLMEKLQAAASQVSFFDLVEYPYPKI
jgi:hypothetical protein